MEILTLKETVSKEDFWFNLVQLKDKSNVAFPLDYLSYKCACDKEIVLFKNGEYFLDGPVSNLVEEITKDKIVLHREHIDVTKCNSTQRLKINEEIGMPENLVFFIDESNSKDVLPFEIEDTVYEPILTTVTSGGAVLALYRNKSSEDNTYLDFFKHNFENHLNQDEEEEETNQSEPEKLENLVSDDESVGEKQDLLPRLSGGGRRLLQDFRYVCLWCSEEVLQQKQRGRFRELRNYRDHFRKAHSDVPMREFLLKVERDEPKWICNICRKKISLGNRLSHQIICRPALESSSSSDNDDNIKSPSSQSKVKVQSRASSSDSSKFQKTSFSKSKNVHSKPSTSGRSSNTISVSAFSRSKKKKS